MGVARILPPPCSGLAQKEQQCHVCLVAVWVTELLIVLLGKQHQRCQAGKSEQSDPAVTEESRGCEMGVGERRAAAPVALSFQQLGKGQSEGGQASGGYWWDCQRLEDLHIQLEESGSKSRSV